MTTKLSDLKKEWLKDHQIDKYYQDQKAGFELGREFIKARIKANMTQSQIAKKMKTTQSVIARLESGNELLTIKTIERFARAVGMKYELRFI